MRNVVLGAADGRTRSPAVRRRRWLSPVIAALVLLIGSGAVVVANQHAHAASDDRNFILITTKGAPSWRAAGSLFTSDGTRVCQQGVPPDECQTRTSTWESGKKSGGRELWHFNVDEGGYITLAILSTCTRDKFILDCDYDYSLEGDRSHCFVVGAFGNARKTGDSLTGGCTPD